MIMNTQEMTNEELATAAVVYYSIAANDNGSYTYLMTLLQGKFGERVDVEELVEAMETRMREFIKEKLDETDANDNHIDFDDIVTEEDGSRWTQICSEHKDLVANDGGRLSDCGSGICGVKGCINESDYYYDLNGDVKPSVTNEIDRDKLVLRWDNTSTRDDSTNFTVYHNDEQVAYGRLNNETNWAHVTMTLSEDTDDDGDLESHLVKVIEERTIRVV